MSNTDSMHGVKISETVVVYVDSDNLARRIRKAMSLVAEENYSEKTLMKLSNRIINAVGVNLTDIVASFKSEFNMLVSESSL